MSEMDAIVKAWRGERAAMGGAVLATVVHVRGSAYRRPGARMLVMPDGRRYGSISGGCLEGDVSKKAWWLTEGGRPVLRTYDSTSDDDAVWEFGLGCNGVVEVLLERLDGAGARAAMEFAVLCRENRTAGAIATVIRARADCRASVGDRLCMTGADVTDAGIADIPLRALLAEQCQAALRSERSRLVNCNCCEVFVEYLAPPVPLVIFGAGHDAIPLVAFAKELGWHVTVADGRPAYARPDRFPGADRIVLTAPNDPLRGIDIGLGTVAVLMTHSYPGDRELLRRIMPLHPRYLGLLGPKLRTERILRDLHEEPVNLHAPIGLDIGAETPEAIALSIVAEIQAVLTERTGAMLKHRPGPIYAPVEEFAA